MEHEIRSPDAKNHPTAPTSRIYSDPHDETHGGAISSSQRTLSSRSFVPLVDSENGVPRWSEEYGAAYFVSPC